MDMTFDNVNIKKNKVSIAEIMEVFQSELSFAVDMSPSQRGNDRVMIIGWTHTGRVLEISVEYFDHGEREHIFHARNAGIAFELEFRRRLR
jgi:uncharacterized DUF497 family protein